MKETTTIPYRALSKEIRESIISSAVKEVMPDKEIFKNYIAPFVLKKTEEVIQDFEKALSKFDDGLFKKVDKWDSIYFELPSPKKSSSVSSFRFDVSSFKGRINATDGFRELSREVFNRCMKLKSFRTKIDKWREQCKKCNELESKVYEIVYGCKSLKNLLEVWPESKNYIPTWAFPKKNNPLALVRISTVGEVNQILKNGK